MNQSKKIIISVVVALLIIAGLIIAFVMPKMSEPSSIQAPKDYYVALGDSVAAGYGLETDSDYSACYRTNEAYSHKLASSLNFELKSLACSGASLSSGILGTQDVTGKITDPQLEQLFSGKKPKLITMTVGANDIDWTSILTKCYTAECDTLEDSNQVAAQLTSVQSNLKQTFSEIQQKYPDNTPKVIVTGYYQVFPESIAACGDQTALSQAEVTWWREQTNKLNQLIESSIKDFGFASFAPIDFAGHDVCASDSWLQDLRAKAPFHPTDAGQAAIARAAEAVYKK